MSSIGLGCLLSFCTQALLVLFCHSSFNVTLFSKPPDQDQNRHKVQWVMASLSCNVSASLFHFFFLSTLKASFFIFIRCKKFQSPCIQFCSLLNLQSWIREDQSHGSSITTQTNSPPVQLDHWSTVCNLWEAVVPSYRNICKPTVPTYLVHNCKWTERQIKAREEDGILVALQPPKLPLWDFLPTLSCPILSNPMHVIKKKLLHYIACSTSIAVSLSACIDR